jgi:hypothetical protein
MRRNRPLAAALLTLGAASAAATALGASGNPPPASPTRAQVAEVPREAAAHLKVLRSERDASDTFPARAAQIVLDGPANATGENIELTRRARSLPGGGAAYAVPGNGTVCVFLTTGTGEQTIARGSCVPTAKASTGEDYRVAAGPDLGLDADQVLAYGIAPDGVDAVDIKTADGHQTAPVVNNVWTAAVPADRPTHATVGTTALTIQPPPAAPGG